MTGIPDKLQKSNNNIVIPLSNINTNSSNTKSNENIGSTSNIASTTSSTTSSNNSSSSGQPKVVPYEIFKMVGQGTFGKVFEAKNHDNKRVAIKKVEKSNHFISREYDILKIINHPNCLKILDMFYTSEDNKKMQNLVFDFIPYTLANLLKKRQPSIQFIRVLFYQLCQAIKHIHSKNICHRDITPNNILLDPRGELTLADFGSAKILDQNHVSMSYICSRYYRAPELLVGCSNYSTKIDIWSIGCILAEMLIGKPIFPGINSNDQLARIIEVLGSPTQEDMDAMKPSKPYVLQLPNITPKFYDTLHNIEDKEVIDLLSKIFIFDPTKRAGIDEILQHSFLQNVSVQTLEQFDEMKCFLKPTTTTTGAPIPTSSSNTSNMASLNSSSKTTTENKESFLSRLNTSSITSTNNLLSSKTMDGKASLSNSNNAVNNLNNNNPPVTIG
ncbi:putative protein serine/threonine kinase [Tieghemostelium lacteum]|uniref:Protein kinase domain-containing protein n=1 Tax=Tieghemostelium lacteum TaxID=361077 RepID=A0A152A5W7_TIELA|nr:putative protein serine/threonine kinase [Tieghemostelium lacteum]|eukprot:KYR01491.1 putative protein serine/threonine kinase [Tieghemostelium lacteum]